VAEYCGHRTIDGKLSISIFPAVWNEMEVNSKITALRVNNYLLCYS